MRKKPYPNSEDILKDKRKKVNISFSYPLVTKAYPSSLIIQDNILAQKERELRDQVKRDRDKEIELVIHRLESETTLSREESERAAGNCIK